MCTIKFLVKLLNKKKIIAYPTESVFGLGCDPDSEIAVFSLLYLKKRTLKKGLILVAENYHQLKPYINDKKLSDVERNRILSLYSYPITWIVPSNKNTPYWITGKFSSVAIRISRFSPIKNLCLAFGKPLVSTSANFSGELPSRTLNEVKKKFGETFPILNASVGKYHYPSEIRDVVSGKLIRNNYL